MHAENRYIKKPSRRSLASIDDRIEQAYYATCAGIEISVMDIGKVYAVGRTAIAEGCDADTLRARILAFVDTLSPLATVEHRDLQGLGR